MAADEEALELDTLDEEESVDEARPLHRWVRAALVTLTVPWIIVFGLSIWLDPYEDGEPREMGTHQQLGLPPCQFNTMTGAPCPSCGMTTSFALLLHADVWNSMKANFAGTALAVFGLLFIPWAFMSAFCGRFVLVRSIEMVVFRLALIFLFIMFGRWAYVLIVEFFFQ